MQENLLTLIPLVAPFSLFLFALMALNKRKNIPGATYVSSLGIVIALASAVIVINNGAIQSSLLGWSGLGFSIRMDSLSILMFSMISLLGFVILKFSNNYMDGDSRKGVFFARLATTIGAVELLVLSGNLFQILIFWAITSTCLHYLLVFYRNRPQAIAAARKKFIVARIGDFALLGAVVLVYQSIGTGDIATLFDAVKNLDSLGSALSWATILFVFAAVLKSAQFPSHGWLIEVVETPTPVSALLHAGLLNAGPFLMVRLSPLMMESTSASMMLILIGGSTALFASVVYMTQPTVKVALGYSSVAHMGFSLLLCGFGVYPAAILHVVAHSFYKAHSFLSSGSVVDYIRSRKVQIAKRKGSIGSILIGLSSALLIYLLFCYMWEIDFNKEFNLMAVGAIIVMGISQVLVNALDSKSNLKAILLSVSLAFVVTFSFFTLESGARLILGTQVPVLHDTTLTVKIVSLVILAVYATVILIQLFSPRLKHSSLGYRIGIHLRNGLYANVLFDRVIGSLKNEKFKWANLEVREESAEQQTESKHSPMSVNRNLEAINE